MIRNGRKGDKKVQKRKKKDKRKLYMKENGELFRFIKGNFDKQITGIVFLQFFKEIFPCQTGSGLILECCLYIWRREGNGPFHGTRFEPLGCGGGKRIINQNRGKEEEEEEEGKEDEIKLPNMGN